MDSDQCVSYIIYRHITPSGKSYIGLTKNGTAERWRRDGQGYRHQMFYNAILKYGWENIQHEILDYASSLDEANQKEKYYIAFYHSNDSKFGYNLTDGGDGTPGHGVSEENRKKIIENNKRMWSDPILSKQMRDHIREAMQTPEMKALHRENFNKLRARDGFRERMVEALPRGEDHQLSRAVYCFETGKRYVNSMAASADTGIAASTIRACATGKQFVAHGLHWCDVSEMTDEEIASLTMPEVDKEHYKGIANGVKVCCVETGDVYPSYIAAARSCGLVSGDRIGISCRKPLNTAGGYHWMHVDRQWDEKRLVEELIHRRNDLDQIKHNVASRSVADSGFIGSEHETGRQNASGEEIVINGVRYIIPQNAKPVCCIETGQVFVSIQEASKTTGATANGIILSCRDIHRVSGGLHWTYVVVDSGCDFDHFLQQRRLELENLKYVDPKCRPVYCVELGRVFESIKDAACQLNMSKSRIGRCCNGMAKTAGGYHWRFVDYKDGDCDDYI